MKAFPNAAVLRLLAAEGLGADVSTLGELELALFAGLPGERLVVHGNNKSDEELEAAARAGAGLVVVDALDEVERAAEAGVPRILVRVTPGVEADTHPSIRTAHEGSKFGLPPEQALQALARAREAGLEVAGVHVHIGSQLLDTGAAVTTVEWVGGFAARCRDELGWTPGVVDLGGGLGIQYVEGRRPPSIGDFVGLVARAPRGRLGRAGAAPPPARPRAGQVARRPRGADALQGRRRQAGGRRDDVRGRGRRHVGQSAPAALRRVLYRAAGRTEPTSRPTGRTLCAASTASPET